jgi:hypothetical protein
MGKVSRRNRGLRDCAALPLRSPRSMVLPAAFALGQVVYCHNCGSGWAPRVRGVGALSPLANCIPPLVVGDPCPRCGQRLRSELPPGWSDL